VNPEMALYEAARLAQGRAIRKARRKRTARRKTVGAPAEPRLSPTQHCGRQAEEQAARYLQQCGLRIVGRNLRCKAGEIDLIATDHGVLVFIEVRHRRSPRFGGAAASVNRQKQLRLIRTAHILLPRLRWRVFGGRTPPCRFDVISVEGEDIAWLRHAFDGW
jgi:putative endonuclease